MEKLTYEQMCRYAEMTGHAHREDQSRAKDYRGQVFRSPWSQEENVDVVVLYEAPRRTQKGKDKPIVCWWVMDKDGTICCLYARYLRLFKQVEDFNVSAYGYNNIKTTLNRHIGGLQNEY